MAADSAEQIAVGASLTGRFKGVRGWWRWRGRRLRTWFAAYYGTTRFDGFAARVGITDAAVSGQLRKLTEANLFTKQPCQEEGKRTRHEYILTRKGHDLLPAVLALM